MVPTSAVVAAYDTVLSLELLPFPELINRVSYRQEPQNFGRVPQSKRQVAFQLKAR